MVDSLAATTESSDGGGREKAWQLREHLQVGEGAECELDNCLLKSRPANACRRPFVGRARHHCAANAPWRLGAGDGHRHKHFRNCPSRRLLGEQAGALGRSNRNQRVANRIERWPPASRAPKRIDLGPERVHMARARAARLHVSVEFVRREPNKVACEGALALSLRARRLASEPTVPSQARLSVQGDFSTHARGNNVHAERCASAL